MDTDIPSQIGIYKNIPIKSSTKFAAEIYSDGIACCLFKAYPAPPVKAIQGSEMLALCTTIA